MLRSACAGLLFALTFTATAWAEQIEIGQVASGPIFYNRPGATLHQHQEELAACFATSPQQGRSSVNSGLVANLIWSGPIAGLRMVRIENCMLLKGWRAVRPAEGEAASLNALPSGEFSARMAQLVGHAAPPGEIVRTFANEALRPGTYHTASRPNRPSRDHLSFRLYQESGPEDSVEVGPEQPPKLDGRWPTRPVKAEDLTNLPPEAALLVVRVTGISNRFGTGVAFARLGATPDEQPSLIE